MLREFVGRLKERKVVRVATVYAVSGYAVLQVANNLVPALNVPRWTVSLIAALYLAGFPIAMILAYAFEHTPQGLRRTHPRSGSAGVRVSWLDWALLGATAAIIAIAVAQFVGSSRAPAQTTASTAARPAAGEPAPVPHAAAAKSIAVLPFVNFSDARDGDYFADGLTEELINGLAQLPDLKVAGRTSTFYFKGRNEDLREIGRKLGVAHVLEGSVRRSGDNLRITAQLVSVADGFHMWSQTYDRTMSDAFAIQTQISQAVAQTLKARLFGPGPRSPPADARRDPRAYELELVARSHLRKRELADMQQARTLFQELRTLEPDNPRAATGYAEATILLAQEFVALDFALARRESSAALDAALQLDPAYSDAWRVKGLIERVVSIRSTQQAGIDTALRSFQRAVELDPHNSDALALYANQLLTVHQHEQATAMLQRALEVDPLSRIAQLLLGNSLAEQLRFAEAQQQFETLLMLYPDYSSARVQLGEILKTQGKLDEAVLALDDPQTRKVDPLATLIIANCYVNLDMQPELQALVEDVREPPTAVALVRAITLQRGHRWQELARFSERMLAQTDDPLWRFVGLVAAVQSDDVAAMKKGLQTVEPTLLADIPVTQAHTALDVLMVIEALRRTGAAQQAERVLAALAARYENTSQYDGVDVLRNRAWIRASQGNIAKSIEELERAESRGMRDLVDFDYFLRLDEYAFMAKVVKEPRFVSLVKRIERDNARMREALRARQRAPAKPDVRTPGASLVAR